ncbi:MAG: hypothetical protein OIF47_07700 [Marinibacterium sp.]|nr:hypothetical protein [Marinibacterium sp.]
MSVATLSFLRLWPARAAAPATPRGAPERRPMPVFIHDAVTPWGDDTVLLALLRAQGDKDGADPRANVGRR